MNYTIFNSLKSLVFASAPRKLFDSQNNIIGYMREQGNRIYVYDRNNTKKGYFLQKENRTYDLNGKFIGKGNLLTSLL